MGRKKSSDGSSVFELTLLALAGVVAAVVFILPYAFAILIYAFPAFVIWMKLPSDVGAEPSLNVDGGPHAEVAQLRAKLRYAKSQWDSVRNTDWGIRWSERLDRFEERSKQGQDLNTELVDWSNKIEEYRNAISYLEAPECQAVYSWFSALKSWHRKVAFSQAREFAWKKAIVAFGGAWFASELIGIFYPKFMVLFSFKWNPFPDTLHPALTVGAIAGWGLGLYLLFGGSNDSADEAEEKLRIYQRAKDAREAAEDRSSEYFSEESSEEEGQENEPSDPSSASTLPWYKILNVDPHSPIDEIKTAFKRAAMACHPDKVAHMNEHIQQVAKEDMQKLNEAFQEAQLARGF